MASTADIRMNQATVASDGSYVYAEAADGSLVKISKASLLKSVKEMPLYDGNLNNLTAANGSCNVYKLSTNCTNTPIDGNGAVCLVFAYDNWVYYQIFIGMDGKVRFRMCQGTSNWTGWTSLN